MDVHVCYQSRIPLRWEFIASILNSFNLILLLTFHFQISYLYDFKDRKRETSIIQWQNWRNRTSIKIVWPLYSFSLVRPLYSFFKKMHNLVMQLYKGWWKLFLTDKLAIVHKMSLLILLKMRFFYWKQRISVPVRPLHSSPKTTFSTFRPK
jgi:hypothetical protein